MTHVYDGDTIEVEGDDGILDVRLMGINAPERGECMSDQARKYLVESIRDEVVGITLVGEDQFGRALGHVWMNLETGGTHVNSEMARLGLAIATTPDDDRFEGLWILHAESQAMSSGLGLWAPDSCSSGPLHDIVIEIRRSTPNPPGPDDEGLDGERVVIRNDSNQKVNIGGWMIRDESSRHRFTFPSGTHLDPGESWTIASSDPGWDPGGSPVWNNDGDIVMLLDRQGRVVDHWRYGQ